MLYTEKEKNEIERVRKVFEKHIQQMTAYDLVWSDKVGYVWLAISIDPVYIDTGNWIESAAGLCYECLNDIALDVFRMTGNDHDFEDADPLELAEIKRRWKPYIDQLPEYAYPDQRGTPASPLPLQFAASLCSFRCVRTVYNFHL